MASYDKTYYTSYPLLIQNTPNLVLDTITVAISYGSSSTDGLITNVMNGIKMQSESMKRVCSDTDRYARGLPSGTVDVIQYNLDMVNKVITQDVGESTTTDRYVLEAANSGLFAEPWLIENRDYDPETNIVGSPPFPATEPVILYTTSGVSVNLIEIGYAYASDPEEVLEFEQVVFNNYNPNSMTYHAYYQLNDTLGQPQGEMLTWFYDATTEVYPILNVVSVDVEESPHYPVFPLIYNDYEYGTPDKADTELYKQCKRALRIIGLEYADIGEGVTASPDEGDTNTDQFVNIVFCMHIQEDAQASLKYLYRYFDYYRHRSVSTKADYQYKYDPLEGGDVVTSPYNIVTMQSTGFKMQLQWAYIDITKHPGVIITTSRGAPDVGGVVKTESGTKLYLKMQTSTTEYTQLEIEGLATKQFFSGVVIETDLPRSHDDTHSGLLVPMHSGVGKTMTTLDYNEAFYYGIRMIANTRVSVKESFWSSGLFQIITIIVAVVVTVLFPPAGVTAFAASAGIGVTLASILYVLGTQIVFKIGMEVLTQVVGDAANFIALIGSLVVGSIQHGVAYIATASNLISVVSSAISTATAIVIKDDMADLAKDYEDLAEAEDILDKEIEKNSPDLTVDPTELIVMAHQEVPGRDPEDMYLIASFNNVGVITLDMPSNFVDSALSLDLPSDKIITTNTTSV